MISLRDHTIQARVMRDAPERPHVFLFGHSFVSRLSREALRQHRSVLDLVGLSGMCKLSVEGHPGLSYSRVFSNPGFYLRRLREDYVHTLIVDIGSNDLCDPSVTPSILVSKVEEFLDLLRTSGISPVSIILFSVIERTRICRPGQVSVNTFNRKVRRFNAGISKRVKDLDGVHFYCQRRVNRKGNLVDGVHLNAVGMDKYCRAVKESVLRLR